MVDVKNNYATFEQYRAYEGIDGLQTPVSTQHGIKAQPLDMDQDINEHSIRGRSSSEEKELTPAQSVCHNLLGSLTE